MGLIRIDGLYYRVLETSSSIIGLIGNKNSYLTILNLIIEIPIGLRSLSKFFSLFSIKESNAYIDKLYFR